MKFDIELMEKNIDQFLKESGYDDKIWIMSMICSHCDSLCKAFRPEGTNAMLFECEKCNYVWQIFEMGLGYDAKPMEEDELYNLFFTDDKRKALFLNESDPLFPGLKRLWLKYNSKEKKVQASQYYSCTECKFVGTIDKLDTVVDCDTFYCCPICFSPFFLISIWSREHEKIDTMNKDIEKEWKITIQNRILHVLRNNTYTILEIINDSGIIYRDVRKALKKLYKQKKVEIKITHQNDIYIRKSGYTSKFDMEWRNNEGIDFKIIPGDKDDYLRKFESKESDPRILEINGSQYCSFCGSVLFIEDADDFEPKEPSSENIRKEREQVNKRIGELQDRDWKLALELTKALEKEKKEQEENR